ncbi:hypothetical protein [Amycolatopsis sp. YIM 10]|uniref:hypothetical protein n=1 Tax=Amycolatopsis sp. YIM 10 TaxID=2653857 RepID=UPI00129011D7|nr:hypothetical protein [Amycolatopsis sp. YIM 10]QFU88034.1 hypothetical protein YIM_14240 [Amycolatopsis sp. YIM 10]
MTAGATPPPPAMPPQFQPYHQPPPPPPRRPGVHGFSVAAGVLALVAAGLLIFGSFLPYTEYQIVTDGEASFSQQTTGWEWIIQELSDDGPSFDETEGAHPPRFGIVLTVAAAVLLIGAFVTVASAGRRASAGVRAGSRLLLSTATAASAIAVWMVALTASSLQSMATVDEGGRTSFRTVYTLGTGLWVLVCGGGVALLALLVAWLPNPDRRVAVAAPGVQMYLEPKTPPHGFAPPMAHQPPHAPPPAPAGPPAPEPYISPFTQVATTESLAATPEAEPAKEPVEAPAEDETEAEAEGAEKKGQGEEPPK